MAAVTFNPQALRFDKPWEQLEQDTAARKSLEENIFYPYMLNCRWFAGKARTLKFCKIQQFLNMPFDDGLAYLIILHIGYTFGDEERYAMPVTFVAEGHELLQLLKPKALITKVIVNDEAGWLIDAVYDIRFQTRLFENIFNNAATPQSSGTLTYEKGTGLNDNDNNYGYLCTIPDLEQSNSSLIFGNKYFFKFYRKLFREVNPEVEMLQFLTEQGGFKNIPAFCGSLTYERPGIPPVTLGLMMEKVASRSDSWVATGDDLNNFLFMFVDKLFGIQDDVFEKVELLGKRTAQMHLALLTENGGGAFEPEHFNQEYINRLRNHFKVLLEKRLTLLKQNYAKLNDNARHLADDFIASSADIDAFFDKVASAKLASLRIRIHGDYHLGQVLFTGSDYLIIDFEGEPESSIADRKIKHSPLKDVAGMIRSFHYAVCAKLYFSAETEAASPIKLQKAADRWYKLITDAYLDAYMQTMGNISAIFGSKTELNFLLQLHLLEKSVYELGYELNGRPDWVRIPLKGIQQVLYEIEKFNN